MAHKLGSRKFWALIIALVTALAGLMTGELRFPEFVMAVVASAASYQVGEGIADGGRGTT